MKNNLTLSFVYCKKVFLFSLICIVLSGCGSDDFSDLDQKLAEIKARPKGKIDPLPPVKVPEPFSFSLDGPRNPFKPMEKENSAQAEEELDNGIKPDPNRVKEDLESYPLDTLRMVGTMTLAKKDTTLWGLVKSNNGTIYRVKVGNYMGMNDGEIIEVTNDEIKLMEIIPEKSPDTEKPHWNKKPASLKLAVTE